MLKLPLHMNHYLSVYYVTKNINISVFSASN